MSVCLYIHGFKRNSESGIRVSDDSALNFQFEIVYASGQINIHRACRVQGRPFVCLDKNAPLTQIL